MHNIVRVTKPRRLMWTLHVVKIKDNSSFKMLADKHIGENCLEIKI